MESCGRSADRKSDSCSIYFAPLEGITGHVYRRAHAECFSGIDRYYLPFIAAHATHTMKNKEKKDVSPAQNVGLCAVPQVLTRNVDDFLWTADELTALGYREINLNMGCPSPTVTSKGKGAAFLGQPDELDRFFEGIFEGLERRGISHEQLRITVKTRLGVESPDEWERIFGVYDRYPISEITVHARTMRELYNGEAHIDTFGDILQRTRIPVCYNGNIFSVEDYRNLTGRFGDDPMFAGVMIGRGLIADPALAGEIRGNGPLRAEELYVFHNKVLDGYVEELSGDTHVISKMKELWWYMGPMFADADRQLKKVRKSGTVREYRTAVRELFRQGLKTEM